MYSTWLICTSCRFLSKWIHPHPGVSSHHSPPVYPVSRDVSLLHWILLYTLQIIRHITSSLSHTSPQCLSAYCLPFVCVYVCVRARVGGCMYTHACRYMRVHKCVCVCVCVCDWGVFSVSNELGHISYLLAHTTSAQLTPFFKLFDALPLH